MTSGGHTYALPDPFIVVATQNPIEQEGTFPLPEAQRDRFQFHVLVGQPDADEERRILDLVDAEESGSEPESAHLTLADLAQARADVRQVHVSPALKDFIVRLVTATREPEQCPEVEHPISPRGSVVAAVWR